VPSVHRAARVCVVVSLLSLSAIVSVGVASAAVRGRSAPAGPRSTQAQVASVSVAGAGAGWIARDISSSGALVDAASLQANAGDTANAILALVAAGYGANQVKTATTWLKAHYSSFVSSNGADIPGRLALVILAAVAAGANPSKFGGSAATDNLVARLEATEQMTGISAGSFGTAPSANAFYQALALLALAAVKNQGKGTKLGEAFLAQLQCTDGGWEYSRITTTTPCVSPSPKDFTSPDTNTTAMAVQAIVATGGHFAHNPVVFFANSQEKNGSFGVYGVSGQGQVGDPESTGYVIQALTALHALNDKTFVRSGVTPEQALASFQYGCKAPVGERGEFAALGKPSQLDTLEAVPAAAGVTLPVTTHKLSVAEPRLICTS